MVVTTPSFVVLHHTGYGESHFDLMLSVDPDGPLPTWRCSSWPIDDATTFVALSAHRRVYLTFEGEVSGGRGRVRRVTTGTFSIRNETSETLSIIIDGRLVELPHAAGP